MENKNIDFEQSLNKLKEILEKINDENTSIDESIKLYEDAKIIIDSIQDALKNVKEKIEKIIE